MRHSKEIFLLLIFAILLFSSIKIGNFVYAKNTTPVEGISAEELLQEINFTKINETIYTLSNSPYVPRVTGYSGCRNASEYIFNKFKEYNLSDVHFENFSVTVPIDYGANLTNIKYWNSTANEWLDAAVSPITAYPLWPNQLNPCKTPPEGLTGELVYVGRGRLSEFNVGKNIADKIVLMEFDSENNWLKAAAFGAKAIVFIMPEEMTYLMTETKKLSIPLYMPRVIVSQKDGKLLKDLLTTYGTLQVRLKSSLRWEKTLGSNVVGFVNGTHPTLKDEIVAFSAHYDAMSIAPSLSPGATDACGIATLLELARCFSKNPQNRTIAFIAFSGHYSSLAGARDFIARHFFPDTTGRDQGVPDDVGSKMKILINLDLATDNDKFGIMYSGYYGYEAYIGQNIEQDDRIIFLRKEFLTKEHSYIEDARALEIVSEEDYNEEKSIILQSLSRSEWQILSPLRYWMDSEPFLRAGLNGISFYTVFSPRIHRNTPSDTFERLNLNLSSPQDNLRRQINLAFYFAHRIVNTEKFDYEGEPHRRGGGGHDEMFCKIVGRIEVYNRTRGWYSYLTEAGIPPVLVNVYFPWDPAGVNPTMDVNYITITDENGLFEIDGIFWNGIVSAYVFDESGGITYAPDFGEFGAWEFSTLFDIPSASSGIRGSRETPQPFIIFECGSVTLYGCLDPRNLLDPAASTFRIPAGPGRELGVSGAMLSYDLLDIEAGTEPESFGFVADAYGDFVLFVSPNIPIMFKIGITGERFPILILTNATKENPGGYGYIVEKGQHLSIPFTPYYVAKDMYWLNEERMNVSHSYSVFSGTGEQYHKQTASYLQKAEEALSEGKYDEFYEEALNAFSSERKAYIAFRGNIVDVIRTTVFFFVLLIPFTFLIERLILSKSGLRRILYMASIFTAFVVALYFLHPGFHLASNVYMVCIGFAMFVLSIPVITMISNDFYSGMTELKKMVLKKHFAEIGRVSAAMMAFSIGLENMKRRKLRSALTLTSVTLIIMSLVAFTAASTFVLPVSPETAYRFGKTPYNGTVIEIQAGIYGNMPLSPEVFYYVNKTLEDAAVVTARYWTGTGTQGLHVYLYNSSRTGFYTLEAIWGVMPQEANVTLRPIESILKAGRWLREDDYAHCLISETVAEHLTLRVNDTVSLRGFEMKVIGIFDETIIDNTKVGVELDEEGILPITDKRAHAGATSTLIVPYRLARDYPWRSHEMGVFMMLAQVAVRFPDNVTKDEVLNATRQLALRLPGLNIFAGFGDKIYPFREARSYSVTGLRLVMVPLVICIFTTLSTVLTAVHERVRETGILNAVGLSPLHIAFLFLAESIVYAVIGAVVGYLLGMTMIRAVMAMQLLPAGFYPNFSSGFVVIAIVASILIVISSSLYPMYKASKLSLPSLRRVWELPTKPAEDRWMVPLPFVATTEGEARGILLYLEEFLGAHTTEQLGVFVIEGEMTTEEKEKGVIALKSKIRVAPWEAAIHQYAHILAGYNPEEKRWLFQLNIERISGSRGVWEKANRKFIDSLRKQFLIWRALTPSEKGEYERRALEKA